MNRLVVMTRVAVALVLCGLRVPITTPLVAAPQDRATREAVTSVAVLVFSNITGDAADDWMGVGIAETVASGLDGIGGLMVIRTGPSETGTRRTTDAESPIAIAQALDARWVVSGAYQRLGDRMRITAGLTHVETTVVVQSAIVDGTVDEFFSLQDRLVTQAQVLSRTGTEASRSECRAIGAPSIPAADETTLAQRRTPAIVIDGPAPPVAPAVINRDAEGRATVRATRLTEEISLDGRLDERVYQTVPALTDFVQQAPDEGAPATERTEAWILFDEENLHVAGRIWDSAPPSEWIANEMRRDTAQLRQNDTFALILDTFYDRRNGVAFYTNALGAIADLPSRTRVIPTATGIQCGMCARRGSRGAGPLRWRSPSVRCATGQDRTRCGACSCGARAAKERVDLPHRADLGWVRPGRDLPGSRHPGRAEVRTDQALWDSRPSADTEHRGASVIKCW